MQDYQREFIAHALGRGVLRFGEFTLKSGRVSPYFFNTGLFDRGDDLLRLGRAYAAAAIRGELGFDMLFGPAYKGIPLVAATAVALARDHDRDVPYAFNRKEVKDHGEGGVTVGAPVEGRVLIVDDVISAGTSVREAVAIIQAAGGAPAGVLIALDRQERGQGSRSAVQEVEAELGLPVRSIVSLRELITFLGTDPDNAALLARMRRYNEVYGA